jgi:cytochrome b
VIWGIWGGHWSRFINFVPTPSKVLAYISDSRRGNQRPSIGHNPLGALSVFAILLVLLLQVFSGLMSDDEISNAGPWSSLVSSHWVSFATNFHTEIGKVALISLLVLHLMAVLFYKYFKHEDLLTAMLRVTSIYHPTHSGHVTAQLHAYLHWAFGWAVLMPSTN